jgi:beta-lactam-binding protein with PASTA domain
MFRRRRRVAETEETVPQRRGRYVREEVAEPPPRRPLIWPWLLLLLLLVAGGLAAAYFLTRDDDGGPETRVPNVVGEPVGDAVRELGQSGYPADVRRRVAQTQIGRVLSQQPDADTELDRGERVVIVVGRGSSTVDVPRVVGLTVVAAFERLQAKQLRGREVRVASKKAKGVVVKQQPGAGAEASKNSLVVLSVSKGPRVLTVPLVEGLQRQAAVTRLRNSGLGAKIMNVPAPEPAGTVIAQSPKAGARVPPGSAVQINVATAAGGSTGTVPTTTASQPTQVTVPDVVGQEEAAARSALGAAGLTMRTSTQQTPDPSQEGVVITQRPLGGQSVARGTRVTIVVGRVA